MVAETQAFMIDEALQFNRLYNEASKLKFAKAERLNVKI